MKKVSIIFASVALSISIIGCGSGEYTPSPSVHYEKNDEKKIEVPSPDSSSFQAANLLSSNFFINRFKKEIKFKFSKSFTSDTIVLNRHSFKIYRNIVSGLGNNSFEISINDDEIKIKYPTRPIICDVERLNVNNLTYFVFPSDNSICLFESSKNQLYFGGDMLTFVPLRTPNKIQILFKNPESTWKSGIKSNKINLNNQLNFFNYEMY